MYIVMDGCMLFEQMPHSHVLGEKKRKGTAAGSAQKVKTLLTFATKDTKKSGRGFVKSREEKVQTSMSNQK